MSNTFFVFVVYGGIEPGEMDGPFKTYAECVSAAQDTNVNISQEKDAIFSVGLCTHTAALCRMIKRLLRAKVQPKLRHAAELLLARVAKTPVRIDISSFGHFELHPD
jgi:hypothetical protein